MAGLTASGLQIKRLDEIIDDKNEQAATIFQDQVPEGDVVDVGPSTSLGRMIGLSSPGEADLWEGIQEVDAAFKPSASVGLSQDELYSLAGLTRFNASATTVYLTLYGSYLTVVPGDSVVSSITTAASYETIGSTTLDQNDCYSIEITVGTVANSTAYTVTATAGAVTRTFSYTSDGSALLSEILTGIAADVTAEASSLFTVATDVDRVIITSINPLTQWDFTKTANLNFSKSKKVVQAIGTEVGPISQDLNTVQTIQTPVLGWDSVTNLVTATPGRNRETDEEFRIRFRDSKYIRGSNLTDSLKSDLLAVSGVEAVEVVENETDSTDGFGIPAHGYMPIVLGGINQDIADVIWKNKPPGIPPYGDITVDVLDIQGQTKQVKFKRPTEVPIYVKLTITDDDDFPDNGEEQIKQALVSFASTNYSIGTDVITSRLYTPINSVPGHYVNSLFIGIAPNPNSANNITIDIDEIAVIEQVNITITVN